MYLKKIACKGLTLIIIIVLNLKNYLYFYIITYDIEFYVFLSLKDYITCSILNFKHKQIKKYYKC